MKRRGFLITAGVLAGGGLLVGVGLRPPSDKSRLGAPDAWPPQEGAVALNAWVQIDAEGHVNVALPRAEMGQGVHTALAMLVADELDADWAQVRAVSAPVRPVYANAALLLNVVPVGMDDESATARFVRGAAQRLGTTLGLQVTGGSSSVRDAWGPMRLAGATARQLLLQAAAARWKVAVSELRTEGGAVLRGDQRLAYSELVAEAAQLMPPQDVPLKKPEQWRFIGQPMPRLDLPAKVNGSAVFGIDIQQPGMVYAALRQAPVVGGSLTQWDTAAVKAQRGVVDAFVLNGHTAVVVADRWWRAEAALKAHPPSFHGGPKAGMNTADMRATLHRALDQKQGFAFRDQGDAREALAKAPNVLRAEYEVPFLAHAPLEPMNATAQVKDGKVTIWAPTQVASLARWKASQVADVAMDAVEVHVPYLGGGFGRRLETDVVEQAVAIALRTQGKPVKLLWSREEDFTHGVYRPMGISRFEAALGSDGKPSAWHHRLAGPSLGFDTTDRLLPGMAADTPDKNHLEGAFELPYAIPHLRAAQLRVPLGLPVGSWRSVGHSLNAYFTECFLDELAQAAKQDPFRYRDELLAQAPKHRAVLRLAAEKAGWGTTPLPAGRARGIALHESFGSVCAQVAEVSIVDGQPQVHRVVCVIDCGTVVNPDTVVAQMQSGIVFGLTAALYGEITVEGGAVQQRNFPQQPLLSMAEMPVIDVHIVPSAAPPGGVGEPATPPIAPAVCNALLALTGQPVRRLPIRLGSQPV